MDQSSIGGDIIMVMVFDFADSSAGRWLNVAPTELDNQVCQQFVYQNVAPMELFKLPGYIAGISPHPFRKHICAHLRTFHLR